MPGTHSAQSLLTMSRCAGNTAFSPESHSPSGLDVYIWFLRPSLCSDRERRGGREEELGDGGLAEEWTSPEEGVDAS